MNWHSLNWIDYIIIGIIAISLLISLVRGFMREALSLASWIIAFWVALTFNSNLAALLKPYISSIPLRSGAAFFILFAATLIIGAIVNYLITTVVDKTGLSGTDRLLGIVFGFGRGVLLVAVILLVARITSIPQDKYWQQSQLVPTFGPVENWLSAYLPADVQHNLKPELKQIKQLIMPDETKPKSSPNANPNGDQKGTSDLFMLQHKGNI